MELFHCDRLHVRLTRQSCARRWNSSNRSRRPGTDAVAGADHDGSPCGGCPVGAAHASGARPDVPLVEVEAKTKPAGQAPGRGATDMPSERTCKNAECSTSFTPERAAQRYCPSCKAAGHGGSNPRSTGATKGVRRRKAANGGATAIDVASQMMGLLQPLTQAERERALKHVELEIGGGDAE